VMRSSQSARFQSMHAGLELTLSQSSQARPEKTLNHLGFRMPDQPTLVTLQRQLEEAGIATQRQEGVECCYALQTKFWVTDPDLHLWELYILHEDIDHSGFEDQKAVQPWKQKAAPKAWTHALTAPLPARLDFSDDSLDEIRLEGTFNGDFDQSRRQ